MTCGFSLKNGKPVLTERESEGTKRRVYKQFSGVSVSICVNGGFGLVRREVFPLGSILISVL
jgi:hypothetical protein